MFPVIRFCDRDKLIGIFSIEPVEIVLDNDMSEFEYLFTEKEIRINRASFYRHGGLRKVFSGYLKTTLLC